MSKFYLSSNIWTTGASVCFGVGGMCRQPLDVKNLDMERFRDESEPTSLETGPPTPTQHRLQMYGLPAAGRASAGAPGHPGLFRSFRVSLHERSRKRSVRSSPNPESPGKGISQ